MLCFAVRALLIIRAAVLADNCPRRVPPSPS